MIGNFLNYVEIRTKITSLFAFLMTLAYLFYQGTSVRWGETVVFFFSMLIFDLATTAINNYIDTKTNGVILPFSRRAAFFIILCLLGVSMALGLYLVILTDVVVLAVGGLCFLCGVFYTYGPLPISRQPLGEVLSGVFYGVLIPFIMLYINMPKGTYFSFALTWESLQLTFNIFPLISLLLLTLIPTCVTANIMLANNICDVAQDIQVKRYTLPYYLEEKALDLFALLYYCIYVDIIFLAALRILHPLILLSLITFFPVRKRIQKFRRKQIKSETFMVSIENYLLIMIVVTGLIFVSGLFR